MELNEIYNTDEATYPLISFWAGKERSGICDIGLGTPSRTYALMRHCDHPEPNIP
jgi:hypothetical protein